MVIVDVVESMRLMRDFEDEMLELWPGFVNTLRAEVVPAHGGSVVKSLGDGMLLGFDGAAAAMRCVLELHRRAARLRAGRLPPSALQLRAGLHAGDVVCHDFDWFGNAVNVAARVATLALPGESCATVVVRDALVEGVDGVFEDLGACYFKHQPEAVRCYRVRAPEGPASGVRGGVRQASPTGLREAATIAVLPFEPAGRAASERQPLGVAVADALISGLSRRRDWRVLSRSSVFPLLGRGQEILSGALGATYAITGRYTRRGRQAHVRWRLVDLRRHALLHDGEGRLSVPGLFSGQEGFVAGVVAHVGRALAEHEGRCAYVLPVPTLDDYALYAGAVTLMHRLSPEDFGRASDLFEHLQERTPRAAAPHAMKARWHVLRMAQGWSADRRRDLEAAAACAGRALQLEPGQAYALSVDALRRMHAGGDLAGAARRIEDALAADPQEASAWMWRAGVLTYGDDATGAIASARHAIALSPLDPMRFMMESYLALALLVGAQYEECIERCRDGLRRNVALGATRRTLVQALALAGRVDEARIEAQRLLAAEPQSRIARYREVYPGREAAHMERLVEGLRLAGLPD